MVRAGVLRSGALLAFAAAALAACGSTGSPGARPAQQAETRTLRFETADDLGDWIAHGGDWKVADSHAVGRSLYPQSNRYSWLTHKTSYGEIRRVVVRGSTAEGSPHNLRLGVGALTALLNWEGGDLNLVHFVGSDASRAGPRALTPGRESEIVVDSSGTGGERHHRLVVDDRVLWEGSGPPLTGTVTVYPALGSTIRVREVVITGRPAPCVEVLGPSMPHF